MGSIFDQSIEYIKGVGPAKAGVLGQELNIFTYGDMLQHYPYRYIDRTKFYKVNEILDDSTYVQVKGVLSHVEYSGQGRKKRLVAYLRDETGEIELVWFQGHQWIVKKLKLGVEYVAFGKPNAYGAKFNLVHPDLELYSPKQESKGYLQPMYSVTEKLKKKFLDSKAISKIQRNLIIAVWEYLRETLPTELLQQYSLIPKRDAIRNIHFPENQNLLNKALYRLKFEEFFYVQLRLLKLKQVRIDKFRGMVLSNTELLNDFYHHHIPFELTNAQKQVIKEIYRDLKSGKQMNRLVQGDVGSGKTMVAFICMLIGISSGTQVCMMAPTEILAEQHFRGLEPYVTALGLSIALLTGSTKQKDRKVIHEQLENGELNILVGTHAVIEDKVKFKNLSLAIVDEQHRFGVAQRAKLWNKNHEFIPHILVMTATPIPRTLAMTIYGDLDVSVIDELPAGRKPITTLHKYDSHRLWVFGFIRKQIALGRQAYIVYPLIEESEKLDLKHLTDGYESITRAFPEYAVSIVHGKMKASDKEFEMQRFLKNETQIMVATTVIEVGVNVPNAAIMVIENAERFGLSQLHQLRGRVGRGADQSYCILMTSYKLTQEGKERINTMVQTNNGFEIAEKDLKLRGPGDIEGTRQSGVLDLLIADIAKDGTILQLARQAAADIVSEDPELTLPKHQVIKQQVDSIKKNVVNWSRIS